MSDSTPQQQGCAVINMVLPFVIVAGGCVGWSVGRPHGIGFGVAGAGAGVVLSFPALGVVLALILGLAAVWDRITRGRWPE